MLNEKYQLNEVAKKIWDKETKYSIWGAANIGSHFLSFFAHELRVSHVYDGNPEKVGMKVEDYLVEDTSKIQYEEETIFVVTCSFYDEIRPILEKKGYIHKKTLFSYEDFEKVYWVYKYNYLRSTRIDISLTERCTLKCKKCNMFMPYFKAPTDQPFLQVKEDIDSYFRVVDFVKYFNLLGGEPFIYPWLKEVLKYLGEGYRHRIERIVLFSNGMIIPDEAVLQVMKKYNVYVQLSDYTKVIPYGEKFREFHKIMDQYGINHYTMQTDVWGDFGFPDNPNTERDKKKLGAMFERCCPPFRGIWQKKVYFCHLETSAVRAELFEDNENDYFDLNQKTGEIKKSFLEFDMGYIKKGYLEFCKVCRGCGCVNNLTVPVAEQ